MAAMAKTAELWPPIARAYIWVHRAASLLANAAGQNLFTLRRAYRDLLDEMRREQTALGELAPAVAHFRKVSTSYWAGLFRCEETMGLPHTNNDLEQCFGAVRHHERRTTGRKGASPALVVRGQVRVVAALAARVAPEPLHPADLRPTDLSGWRALRAELAARQHTRRLQLRFRRNPADDLADLEDRLLKSGLPA